MSCTVRTECVVQYRVCCTVDTECVVQYRVSCTVQSEIGSMSSLGIAIFYGFKNYWSGLTTKN